MACGCGIMVIYKPTTGLVLSKLNAGVIMAGGFAKDGAVQDQIDATIEDAVNRARSQIPKGNSLRRCEQCDKRIPEARRVAIAGVRMCVACQSELDKKQSASSGYNRRGSKDSQLR